MAAESNKKSYAATLAALAIIAAIIAVLAFAPRPDSGNGGGNEPAVATGNAIDPGDEEIDFGAWTIQPVAGLLLKAEDALELRGKMKLERAEDNKGVLDAGGDRAAVQFVLVEDEACGENEDPSLHAATFELRVDKAGVYYPWARTWWMDSCGDSISVAIQLQDSQTPTKWEITDGTYEWWHWLALAGSDGVELKQGVYTVTVENREDGARLSRILFSTRDYETSVPTTPEG